MVNNLYVLETITENHFCSIFDPKEMTVEKWHIMLGHPSLPTMRHMKNLSREFTESVIQAIQNCEVYLKAKQPRDVFPILKERTETCMGFLWGRESTEF